MTTDIILGADLASKHGAIVDNKGNIVYYYSKQRSYPSLEDIYQKMKIASSHVPIGSKLAIDWCRDITSWGHGASTGTLLTLHVIMFGMHCRLSRKSHVLHISPKDLRACLGLGEKTTKETVHEFIWDFMPDNLKCDKIHSEEKVRGDMRDAWILTQVYKCASKKGT